MHPRWPPIARVDPRTVSGVSDETDEDAGSDDASPAFVGTEPAAAKLDALLARPGMAGRVAEVRAQMDAADNAAVADDADTR
jgi:hypothetical protein